MHLKKPRVFHKDNNSNSIEKCLPEGSFPIPAAEDELGPMEQPTPGNPGSTVTPLMELAAWPFLAPASASFMPLPNMEDWPLMGTPDWPFTPAGEHEPIEGSQPPFLHVEMVVPEILITNLSIIRKIVSRGFRVSKFL